MDRRKLKTMRITCCLCVLFLFAINPTYAQRTLDKSVTDFQNRSAILNYVDQFCKSYADRDTTFFKDNFENCLRIYSNGRQMSGERYFQNLKRQFAGFQDLQVSVEDIKIVGYPNKENIYGVYMIMTYYGGGYKDKGYCFWIIDLRDSNRICTHVSTWQSYDTTPAEDRFGIGDFSIDL